MDTPNAIAMIFADESQSAVAKNYLFTTKVAFKIENFSSLRDFLDKKANASWLMVIIDMKSVMKADANSKEDFRKIEEFLPVLRIKVSGEEVGGTVAGNAASGQELKDIVTKLCNSIEPRRMRRSDRHNLLLNIEFMRTETKTFMMTKTNTFDVSQFGMFVISGEKFIEGESLVIDVKDGPQNLVSVVRWILPWGTSTKHPAGIGVEIISGIDEWKEFITDKK